MQNEKKPPLLLYSKIISALFLAAGVALVLVALLLVPDGADSTVIRIHKEKLFSDWFPVCWGTALSEKAGHLLVRPLAEGKPWVGLRFQRTRRKKESDYRRPVIDRSWRESGALCFHIRGTVDAEGLRRPPPALQFFFFTSPEEKKGHPVRLRPWHFKPPSADKQSAWREVAVPLRLFDFPSDFPLFAIAFQAAGGLHHPFALKEISLEQKPETELEHHMAPDPGTADFPALVELGENFPPEKKRILSVEQGTIFSNGSPEFLLAAQLNYDMRFDIWGESLKPPDQSEETWAGYGADLAWLYETLPDYAQLARLGLTSWCVSAPPEPFLNQYLEDTLPGREAYDAGELKPLAQRIALPLFADLSAYPWTLGFFKQAALGKPITVSAKRPDPEFVTLKEKPPETAFSPRGSHFMPFSLLPEGRALALRYFTETARFFQEKNIPVFQFELFNEPAYPSGFHAENDPVFEGHRKLFARFLRKRHPDKQSFISKAELENASEDPYLQAAQTNARDNLFLWEELCTHAGGLFIKTVRDAMEEIPKTYTHRKPLFSVQLNRSDVSSGTFIIQPDKLFSVLPLITAPTDGGTFSPGQVAETRPSPLIKSPIAPAPLTADLLQCFSQGTKPVFDQEFACPGDPVALKRKLWTRVLLGFDGVALFSWSKRAWQWHTEEEGKKLAERYPFCLLNPFAHSPSELAAVTSFRKELLPFTGRLLPRPFGVRPVIGVLHSYTNERAYYVLPTPQREARMAYAMLRYSTIPLAMITGRQLQENDPVVKQIQALFLCGISVLEKETLRAVNEFAERGGTVFLVNSPLSFAADGTALSLPSLSGGACLGETDRETVTLQDLPVCGLPGPAAGIAFRKLLPGTAQTILRDNRGAPRAVLHTHDNGGNVYTLSFASDTCSLLRLFLSLLERERIASPWELSSADGNDRCVNVLVSVRDRDNVKLVLLANQDRYLKKVRFRWPALQGAWRARIHLEGESRDLETFTSQNGSVFHLPAGGVKLLELTRFSEPK